MHSRRLWHSILTLLVLVPFGCASGPPHPNDPPEIRSKEMQLKSLVEMRDLHHSRDVSNRLTDAIEALRMDLGKERYAATNHIELPDPPPGLTGALYSEATFAIDSTRWRLSIIETYEDVLIGAKSPEDAAKLALFVDEIRGRLPEWFTYVTTSGRTLKGGVTELTARAEGRVKTLDAAIQAKKSDPALLQKARAWWQALPAQLPR